MKAINGRFFNRGVHVKDMKYLSKDKPIEELNAPDTVCICLNQHIGKSAKSLVAKGDKVKAGQLIAAARRICERQYFFKRQRRGNGD